MYLMYFGAFDPPHTGHVQRLAAAQGRCRPERTIIVPLDFYDGDIPGRRILRAKLAATLAHATDAEYSDAGLSTWNLQTFVARLADRSAQPILALFDPELPRGLRAEDLDPQQAGIDVVADDTLDLPSGLPRQKALQRSIGVDEPDWRRHVVAGVAPVVTEFGLYGWTADRGWW